MDVDDNPELQFTADVCQRAHPDLRDFDPLRHQTIVFDECAASLVANHREVFQGTTEDASLGHSATNIHAYKVWLYVVKTVVTMNRWLEDVATLDPADQAWPEHNSIVAVCAEKLCEE